MTEPCGLLARLSPSPAGEGLGYVCAPAPCPVGKLPAEATTRAELLNSLPALQEQEIKQFTSNSVAASARTNWAKRATDVLLSLPAQEGIK